MNSSHRPEPYFEWFYFHFVTDDGAAINLVLHETDIFGLKLEPYLSLSFLEPGQKPRYLRPGLYDGAIARERPYLEVGEGLITESLSNICLDIDFPTQGMFRAEISKLAPPLVIEDGILYEEPRTGRLSHWIVQVPHATFTGILQLDGVARRLRGVAYQDHQWGTVLIQEFVSDWVWGHFSNDQVVVVFFQILTQTGKQIERVAMLNDEGRFTGTTVKTDHLGTLYQADRLEALWTKASVSFLNQCFQLELHISPENLMRSHLDEEHGDNMASYLRWMAEGDLLAGNIHEPLYGVIEYLRLRPIMVTG